ncbi:hypothetical protein FIBSPDRAFT_804656, partial [Athelia psychrophila]
FVNNCGYGTPLFLYEGDATPQGAATISGQLLGGIAWLGDQGSCEASGVNCGAAEFTLVNTGYSQADITLEPKGNHVYSYPISLNFINGCNDGLSCTSSTCADASFTPTQVPLVQCFPNNPGVSLL